MTPPAHTSTIAVTTRRPVLLLGPQHNVQSLREGLAEAGARPPFVLVAAGWEEREAETAALEEHLGAPVANLSLWPACEAAFEADHELRAAMFARHDRLRELGRLYRIRLAAELGALREMLSSVDPASPGDLVGPSLEPAFRSLIALDEHHLGRVAALNDEVFGAVCSRPSLARHREEVARQVAEAGTLLVAGGHVGILYNRMRLFGVIEALPAETPVAGWSAGGMVLTERILLFHDSPPQGPGDAEMHGPGFGVAQGIAALPHSTTRLDLGDAARVALLARRVGASARAVGLDDGQRVLSDPARSGWRFDGGARLLGLDGAVSVPAAGAQL